MSNFTPIDRETLLLYEMPIWFEYIFINWLQDLLAKYLAHKVNRKMERYSNRKTRFELLARLKEMGLKHD